MNNPIPNQTAPSLLCGEDYSVSFRAGTYLPVESTSNASPIVVTITNHGFSNGQTKILSNCDDASANGTWVIGNVTTHTFTLTGSAGQKTGGAKGYCTTPYDITGKTVRAALRSSVLGTLLTQLFTITVNSYPLCSITLGISHADTKAIQSLGLTELYTDVWADDVPLISMKIPVVPAGTIF